MCDSTVLEQVETSIERVHTDGLIEDFCDGTVFMNHPLFSRDPYALQIIAHYDEVEICNPLGSHVKKYKLGIVFYTLGNIAPKYRSQLKLINLAIIATNPIIEKHGLDKVLEPFINDLNTLSSKGITVSVHGVPRVYKGALLAFLADNLASNQLGGFKESFSFSFRCCRSCLATKDSFQTSYVADNFKLRTMSDHKSQLKLVNGPLGSHYSTTYGINRESSLLKIKNFSLFGGGLPHDAMHDILEGIAPLEVKHLLLHCISDKKYFTLRKVNDRLLHFNYGYTESDKPPPILSQTLHSEDKSLRLSSSQALLLVRILPFVIAEFIPHDDVYWHCFLLLRKIMDIVFCPLYSESLCTSLKSLIKEHHTMFVRLYKKFTPKFHFLLHYADQITAIGPMTCSWTIRYEAKLNFFKQASRIGNFKNVAFSLANRHQRWACYEMASEKLISISLACGPARKEQMLLKDENQSTQDEIKKIIPEISLDSPLFYPSWVSRNSKRYQNNNAYLIIGSDGLDPEFGQVDDLIVVGGDMVIFVMSKCQVLYFDSHYHAYVITITPQRLFICTPLDHNVYHGHKLNDGLTYITLKYYLLSQ